MPRRDAYVPRHRAPSPARVSRTPKVIATSVAVAVTGVSVSAGVLADSGTSSVPSAITQAQADADGLSAEALAERGAAAERGSRAAGRDDLDDTKVLALAGPAGGGVTEVDDLADADPRDVARSLLDDFGFSESEFSCLDQLWVSESNWEVDADNPISSAYGIPQALTGGTHDNLPADYMTNPVSQIRWGLGYIRDAYGTPCSAWSFKQANNWY